MIKGIKEARYPCALLLCCGTFLIFSGRSGHPRVSIGFWLGWSLGFPGDFGSENDCDERCHRPRFFKPLYRGLGEGTEWTWWTHTLPL